MKLTGANTAKRQLITLTPLIDVVFILLLFFMLSTNFFSGGTIALDLGTATTKNSPDVFPEQFTIRLLSDGDLFVDNERIAISHPNLATQIEAAFQNNRQAVIQFDNEADVQGLTSLLDVLNGLAIDADSIRVGW